MTRIVTTKPPRWRSARDTKIVAAARQGASHRAIAAEFGISYQRVSQILAREGVPAVPRAQRAPPPKRVAVTCAVCDKVRLVAPGVARRGLRHCSRRCVGIAMTKAPDDAPAILALRADGLDWATVGRRLGISPQVAQSDVWKHLAATGRLTAAVVLPIWRTRQVSQPPRWHWLEQRTGQRLQP
jgi:hypothetical protein